MTRFQQVLFTILLIMSVACFACGSDDDSDPTDGDASDGDSSDGDLADGDAADGDATDGDSADGDTTDGDSVQRLEYPPLARKTTTLIDVDEPVFFLPQISEDYFATIRDDKGSETPGEEIGQITDLLMTDQPNGRLMEIKSGDIDADGKDEMVILSLYTDHENDDRTYRYDYPRITIIDDKDAGFAIIGTIDKTPFAVDPLNPEFDSYLTADLALANLDDDDGLEIVFAGTYGRIDIAEYNDSYRTYQYASVLVTFDDAGNGFSKLAFNSEAGVGVTEIKVDAGDVDRDNRDEIFIIGHKKADTGDGDRWFAQAWALDDHVDGYTELYHWHNRDDELFDYSVGKPNVVCGDFDGDGIDEVTFGAVSRNGYCRLQTRVYDDALNEFVHLEGKYIEDCPNRTWDHNVPLQLEAGDIDGNGKDDVLIAVHDVYYNDRGWYVYYFRPDRDDSGYVQYRAFSGSWENVNDADRYSLNWTPSGFRMDVGDYDRDGKADVFAMYYRYKTIQGQPPYGEDEIVVEGFDAKRFAFKDDEFEVEDEWSWDWPETLPLDTWVQPLVGLGDFDGDSMVVRYTGDSWLAMSEPRIVVAMAMPPGWASIPQDNKGNTWVGYGQVRTESSSESNEISMSASVTMSVEASDPFNIVSAKASTTLKTELTKTQTQTKTVSTGVKRVGNWAPDDLSDFVIYTATEYERFQYEVITHEDPTKVGTLLTIDVPLQTNTFKKTVKAFNEQNGDYRDIGVETFTHTVGDPSTYPDKDARDALLATYTGWMTPDPSEQLLSIGEASAGGTEAFISMGKENAQSEARTLGVEVSAGFSVGGVGVESTVGLSNTNIYEIAVAESTDYAGSVGDIPSSHFNDYEYYFGMFVYNFERDDGVKYQVINWCVEQ